MGNDDDIRKRKPKARGNRNGSVFKKNGSRTWTAQITVGWREPKKEGGHLVPIKKTIGGFKTKQEALIALNKLLNGDFTDATHVTLNELYESWEKSYKSRVLPKTMDGYKQAFNHFKTLHYREIRTITAKDLQDCMDACSNGKRTHEMMKVIAGLLWGYALDAQLVTRDVSENLYVGKHKTTHRKPLTDDEIKGIKDRIGKDRYAEYIYCLCYMGFRPGEMLKLKKNQVYTETVDKETVYYVIGGGKTEAGTDRIVIIPEQIRDIILDRLFVPGTDYVFPLYIFHRYKKHFIEFREMSHNYLNNYVFKPVTQTLGITGKVPYSARHSYANKLKKAAGDNKDKAELIGHTDYDFTQHRYQTSELADLKAVTDTIE